ncbi:MAG TPA: hypothetical protein VNO22_10855 [Planctomycetota bacterium]|nr:hypothetical protein [Planctomycetota bacterium]
MEKLIAYFRRTYAVVITDRAARRLVETVHAMEAVDPQVRLGVTGSDAAALVPRRVDVTLAELRAALAGRRHGVA